MPLPNRLYRGDSDPQRTRRLREVYPGSAYAGLLSNLSSGGRGQEIFSAPWNETIAHHIHPGWSFSHYLSFSTDRDTALYFASGPTRSAMQVANVTCWDSLLVTLNSHLFESHRELETGIHLCAYKTAHGPALDELSLPEVVMRQYSKSKQRQANVLLIDTVAVLRAYGSSSYSQAIKNAERDNEWLVLPVDLLKDIPGEFTARLDDGCIEQVEFFRLIPQSTGPCA